MDDRFRVASCAVAVTLGFQLCAQLGVIVNFAVKDDPKALVFIRNWLMSGLNVDDAEPPHGEANIAFNEKTFVVRASMHDLAIHARENISIDSLSRIRIENAADTAHD